MTAQTESGLELEWDYAGRPSLDALAPRYVEPSFVIDFDESSVEKLAAEATRRLGDQPTQQQLTELVAAYIETSEGGRFDIASRVASRQAGDCTEHAVLLAALGRSFGIPSRVIMGYVLMPELGMAIGHAWTEMHDGARWVPSDSALRGEVNNRYLKTGELRDEGVRYRLTNMSELNPSIDEIALRGPGRTAEGSR